MAPFIASALTEQHLAIGLQEPKDFVAQVPQRPLWRAGYSRENALRPIAGTEWELESQNDPEAHIQNFMICKPIQFPARLNIMRTKRQGFVKSREHQ
jgi:hypothetical protein